MIVKNNIKQLMTLIDTEAKAIIREEPTNIQNDLRQAMNQAKSGRIYTRRGIQHQASAPGEAPAIDTANYVNSIQTKHESQYRSAVQSDAPQALALELGRPDKGLLPRPAWVPAAHEATKRIVERFKKLARQVENV